MMPAIRPGVCTPAVTWVSLLALFTIIVVFPRDTRAEGLSGYIEFDYSMDKRDAVQADGRSIRTDYKTMAQWYNITLDKSLYPNLKLFAAGNFRRADGSIEQDGVENEVTTTTFFPAISLNLKTPLYKANASYNRREEKVEAPGLSPFTMVRDFYLTTLYWRPDRFPDLKLQFSRDDSYDKDRSILDTTTDLYQITSNYRPVEPLSLYYQGTYRDSEVRLSGTTTEEMTQNGRVNYANGWWRRRVTLDMGYNIRHREIDVETTGAGEVGLQVFPWFGLSALSDDPQNVRLDENPDLINGNLTAGTGINLGSGGNTTLRNLGLDFLVATEINTLYVWVDRDVAQVAGAFSWRIYTSDDNRFWQGGPTVAPAIYSPTFNRFEIRFPNVNARYVKLVTAPLTPTHPYASSFRDIFVTELQAEIRRPASQVAGNTTSTFQTGNANFRALLLESIGLTYDLWYFFKKLDPGDTSYTVSNGLSFFRQFNNVYSGNGRISYEYGEGADGTSEAFLYAASVTAVPIKTLFHSLTLSGREETVAGKRDSEISILLYNNAKVYEGIDTNLSGSISFREDATGGKTESSMVNAGVTFVPNQKTILNLFYNGTTTISSGGNLPEEITTFTRTGEANLSITPVQTVYLYGSFRIEHSTDFPNRNIWNYSLNWSPFPDGTLKLGFFYNETIRTDDTSEKSLNPSLQWYFMPRSFLLLSYQNYKTEAPTLTVTSDIYSATVRINF